MWYAQRAFSPNFPIPALISQWFVLLITTQKYSGCRISVLCQFQASNMAVLVHIIPNSQGCLQVRQVICLAQMKLVLRLYNFFIVPGSAGKGDKMTVPLCSSLEVGHLQQVLLFFSEELTHFSLTKNCQRVQSQTQTKVKRSYSLMGISAVLLILS